MAIKIELINAALVMHDTVTLEVLGETPKRLVYYDVSELDNNNIIKLISLNPTEEAHRHWKSVVIGATTIDGGDAAYTVASWKTFARTNLGF
jgi:hypothetical protein